MRAISSNLLQLDVRWLSNQFRRITPRPPSQVRPTNLMPLIESLDSPIKNIHLTIIKTFNVQLYFFYPECTKLLEYPCKDLAMQIFKQSLVHPKRLIPVCT